MRLHLKGSTPVKLGAQESASGRLLFLAAALALSIILAVSLPLHFAFFSKAFFCAAIFVVVYLRLCTRKLEVLLLIAFALFLALIRLSVSGWSPFLPLESLTIFLFFGLASLLMLIIPIPWCPVLERQLRMSEFGIALGVSTLTVGIDVPLRISAKLSPQTLDYNLYLFDNALGFQSSFVLGRVFAQHQWLAKLSGFVYYGLPLMYIILATGAVVTSKKPDFWKVMLVAGVIGASLYTIVPAAGPIFVLQDYFPFLSPSADRFSSAANVALNPEIPRNCMPSLHFGWALLICMNVGWSSWRKVGSYAVLLLTAIATLGFGQHYLVDLIVAIPFVMMIQSGAAKNWFAASCHGAITFGWLFALRWASASVSASSWIAWLLVIVTLGAVTAIALNPRCSDARVLSR